MGILLLSKAPTADDLLNVTAQSTGNFSANAFSGFTTPATTVFTATQKFLKPNPDDDRVVALCNRVTRDQEITTYTGRGEFYLRLVNGTALYCNTNSAATNGDVRIGIVTGLDPAATSVDASGTRYALYVNTNANGTLSGYSTMDGTSTFTFGCSGFTVYLKINGVTVVSFTEWRHMLPGQAGVWAHNGYGCRDVRVSYPPGPWLYSDCAAGIFDTRDFGMRAVPAVTGSMTSGSNRLRLNARRDFRVGDTVIVETGGESGSGLRNSVGVGGTWPSLSYANLTALNADSGKPDGTWAYIVSTGAVYSSLGGVWSHSTTGGSSPNQTYYQEYVTPLALVATVTAVNGGQLTLDTNASADATNANVWLDCKNSFFLINQARFDTGTYPAYPSNVAMRAPAGTYAVSGLITNGANDIGAGFQVYGAGRTLTEFFNPKGCRCVGINMIVAVNGVGISDLKWTGNFSDTAGVLFAAVTALGSVATAEPVMLSITGTGGANTGFAVERVDIVNCVRAVALATATNPLIHDCTVTLTVGQRNYLQWQMSLVNAAGGQIKDCTGTAPYGMKTFELFSCVGASMVNCGGQNVRFSNNSSSNSTVDLTQPVTVTANSWFSIGATPIDEPIFFWNSNSSHSGGTGSMICRPGFTCIQAGYVDASNNSFKFIQITSDQPDWTITGGYPGANKALTTLGGYFEAPNYNGGSDEYGAMLVYSDGARTAVTGLRVVGSAIGSPGHSSHYGNISLGAASSAVTNCVADAIQSGPTLSGNQTN